MAEEYSGSKSEHLAHNFDRELACKSLAKLFSVGKIASVSAPNLAFLPGVLESDPKRSALQSAIAIRACSSKHVLFAIHVSRDNHTAVYRNTSERAEYLRQQGHSCTIVTPDDFPWLQRVSPRFTPLLFPLAVARFLSHQKFDAAIFHSHAGWAVSLLRKYMKCHRDLKVAISFHGLEPLYFSRMRQNQSLSLRYRWLHGTIMHRLLRTACRDSDLLFCLNSEEEQYLVLNQWSSRDRIAIMPHPAPDDFFIRRKHRERGLSLLFVGQWLPMKGIEFLVDAFTRLSRENRELRLGCIGTLVPESTVLDQFPADVRPHVTVRARVTHREILQFHRHSDLFIFPSLSEGFGLAIAEAMASGLPIVTTPVGAASDYLRHQTSALFIPMHEAGPIVTAVTRLVDDKAMREKLGQGAQQAAEQLRTEKTWQTYARYFERLMHSQDPLNECSA